MLRILAGTNCHLGYMEKDEIWRFDSFEAFEEICSLAKQKEVDFVLLGGDLIHEDKPSRSTLVKTIVILRRYFLLPLSHNDNLSAIHILSACNLVNYFGKIDLGGSVVHQIVVHPVLVKKVPFHSGVHIGRPALAFAIWHPNEMMRR
ncbi:double-strand break repair protein MRE11 isoform X2 [Triticum aestivum]|nr:double-strand break repair protein MRE11-like isoform X2 [Triticum aestivum]